MFKKLKKHKGFTLTETIVVVAIIALLMACVVAFAGPVRRMIWGTTAKNDAVTINKIMSDYVERRLAYANYINVVAMTDCTSLNTTDLDAGFKAALNRAGDANNRAGMLVFKYIDPSTLPDDDDDSPYASIKSSEQPTYRLYDVPITTSKSSLSSLFGEYGLPSSPAFDEGFYAGYQYFVTLKPISYDSANNVYDMCKVNTTKGKAYMSFEIDSFDFSTDYGYAIDGSTMETYFNHIKDSAATPTNGLDDMYEERTGFTQTTLALENIRIETRVGGEVDADGNPVLNADGTPVSHVYGATNGYYSSVPETGNDIVVFYNIKNYGIF